MAKSLERAKQEAGDCQERRTQGNLHDNQDAPSRPETARSDGFERGIEVAVSSLKCWSQPEQQGCQHAENEREAEDPQVRFNADVEGKASGVDMTDGWQSSVEERHSGKRD